MLFHLGSITKLTQYNQIHKSSKSGCSVFLINFLHYNSKFWICLVHYVIKLSYKRQKICCRQEFTSTLHRQCQLFLWTLFVLQLNMWASYLPLERFSIHFGRKSSHSPKIIHTANIWLSLPLQFAPWPGAFVSHQQASDTFLVGLLTTPHKKC